MFNAVCCLEFEDNVYGNTAVYCNSSLVIDFGWFVMRLGICVFGVGDVLCWLWVSVWWYMMELRNFVFFIGGFCLFFLSFGLYRIIAVCVYWLMLYLLTYYSMFKVNL